MLTKHYLPLGVFVVVLIFLWRGLYIQPNANPAAIINKPIPKFNLPALDTQKINLTEKILHNKVSVLHIWATWCAICKQDHQFLTTVNKTDEFQLVGIYYKDLQNNADQWLNLHGNPYRVTIFDSEGSLSMDLGAYGTPTTYIVDRAGIIRHRHVGALTNELWQKDFLPKIKQLSS